MPTVTAMTVSGPIRVDQLGVALMHEHLSVIVQANVRPDDPEAAALLDQPVEPWRLALLRQNPYASTDNCTPPSVETIVLELSDFARRGGGTIVDTTGWNIGRDPDRLLQVARRTGLHVVMGSGLYLERTHPRWAGKFDEIAVCERIVAEWRDGVQTSSGVMIRPGIIGEIGVSVDFTGAERTSLRGSARAQLQTGLPLMVHLPGWRRVGHEVLDICESVGVDPNAVVLAHMDPSWNDFDYQSTLAARGAHVEFDGIGMGIDYPGEGESPSDAEIARGVHALFDAGFGDRLLLSHDVFLKIQLRSFGGNGFAHVLRSFLPRLARLGLDPAACSRILVDNPRGVFQEAAAAVANR